MNLQASESHIKNAIRDSHNLVASDPWEIHFADRDGAVFKIEHSDPLWHDARMRAQDLTMQRYRKEHGTRPIAAQLAADSHSVIEEWGRQQYDASYNRCLELDERYYRALMRLQALL